MPVGRWEVRVWLLDKAGRAFFFFFPLLELFFQYKRKIIIYLFGNFSVCDFFTAKFPEMYKTQFTYSYMNAMLTSQNWLADITEQLKAICTTLENELPLMFY